ncbi:ectonucleoside triphosphate diphosphohydrolase 5-like isoform X3 [Portunus trituberculatus]|uniref:ectonucleoside triphosphate diphosphohydrolase 5-like isoform X3 n=1 Tax=Portunus trituberculatus TaxID=210409 RepID=UPI001E1CFFE1|nr:ectonucleoside triphosphate diphosphohydrolase 5-like isoform X3 [Portunus trituberculatus]
MKQVYPRLYITGGDPLLHKKAAPPGGTMSSFRLIRFLFYGITVCLAFLLILVTLNNTWPLKSAGHTTNSLDHVSVALGVQERTHAVVLDAGSTGSRVLAFTFFKSRSGGGDGRNVVAKGPLSFIANNSSYDNSLKLDDELWHEVKPGLSSFADDPVKGAESLLPLLKLAKERIPEQYWSSTPLVLKATAGLRLLPDEKAEALLLEVKKVLSNSGFHTTENSVGIMDGRDEGIFSWFTVNYLLDRITGTPKDTLVALDLGGGSTQITFVPMEDDTVRGTPADYLTTISLLHKNLNLYTHSYLGLGLMAARKAILVQHRGEDGIIHSPCVNPIVDHQWTYGGETYTIRGPEVPKYQEVRGQAGRLSENRPVADYKECVKTCMAIIKEQVHAPKELKAREVIAFSYFFDRATERGLIDPFKGGVLTMQELLNAATQTCSIPNVEQPLACLDLTFITTLLTSGYGLQGTNTLKLYKRIDNHEVSWALGLAFHVINNGI